MCFGSQPKAPKAAATPPPPPPPPPAPEATATAPVVNAQQTDTKSAAKAGRAGTRSLRIDLSTSGGAYGGSGLNIPA